MEKLTNLDRIAEEILGLIPTETVIIALFDGDSIDYRAGRVKTPGQLWAKGEILPRRDCVRWFTRGVVRWWWDKP